MNSELFDLQQKHNKLRLEFDELKQKFEDIVCKRNEFVDTPNGIKINKLFEQTNEVSILTPTEWMRERVFYSKDSQIHLQDICKAYYKRQNVTLVEKASFVHEANLYLAKTFFDNHDVKRVGENWYNLVYFDKDDPFNKWLDENIVYKKEAVLKLGDVCQSYLNLTNMHSFEKTKYKHTVENFIKINLHNQILIEYKTDIKYKHGKIRVSDRVYTGWKHLTIKQNN